ncbi:hypothetical protein [Pelagovum pacificum]|nr:hypothetical protein [Pelagovum pacificum]QQA41355.1 hypothetical protein I8N54_10990 [Pelagovum pacificum]
MDRNFIASRGGLSGRLARLDWRQRCRIIVFCFPVLCLAAALLLACEALL